MKLLGSLCVLAASASACATPTDAQASPGEPTVIVEKTSRATSGRAPESNLGVVDTGIFSDLDARTQIRLPSGLEASETRAVFDAKRSLLLLFVGDWPVKVYPTTGTSILKIGETTLNLRPGDKAELAPLLRASALQVRARKPRNDRDRDRDRDRDGIPDDLDVLVGAIKTVHNGADYGGGYRRIKYPGGDIPREDGVCTDVVVRAVRNAGLDIQAELQRDIKRSPRSFPMVKKPNPNIDHRRVKTMLPYFERQWEKHTIALDDEDDPLRPGDIIFMDTFPKRRGPDHIGVVSNRRGDSGHFLVINNWTNGFKTSEMDLLNYVPLTHRFRIP